MYMCAEVLKNPKTSKINIRIGKGEQSHDSQPSIVIEMLLQFVGQPRQSTNSVKKYRPTTKFHGKPVKVNSSITDKSTAEHFDFSVFFVYELVSCVRSSWSLYEIT